MITTNTIRLNNGLQDQTQREQYERVFLFDKPIRPNEMQKKTLKMKRHEAQHFPQKCPNDRSFTGPWFRRLEFEDDLGVVHKFRYAYWKDGQYAFNGKELWSYLEGKKVEVGDVLSFWRNPGEKECFFITIKRRSTSHNADKLQQGLGTLPAEQGGGGAASTSIQPVLGTLPEEQAGGGVVSTSIQPGKEGNSTLYSIGSVAPSSETEGRNQHENIVLLPSFGGPHDIHHHDLDNVAMIDSSIDGHQYLAPVDNSFTTSIMSGWGSSFVSSANLESFTSPFHNFNYDKEVDLVLEGILNFSNFDTIENYLNQNSEVGPISHDELVMHYYKQYQVKDPGLEAQLKDRNCDPYAENLVIKYVGTVMKKIFHSTSVKDVLAPDHNHSEIKKYMQPLRDLCLNLPVLEGLVAVHKSNPFEEVRSEDVHAAKKARTSF